MEKVSPVSHSNALKLCAESLGDDALDILELLHTKRAEAFLIGQCCFITRFDLTRNDKQLVVMYAEGKGLLKAGRTLREIAKKHNCTSARMHTSRKGLSRFASEFGWKEQEVVYQMSI